MRRRGQTPSVPRCLCPSEPKLCPRLCIAVAHVHLERIGHHTTTDSSLSSPRARLEPGSWVLTSPHLLPPSPSGWRPLCFFMCFCSHTGLEELNCDLDSPVWACSCSPIFLPRATEIGLIPVMAAIIKILTTTSVTVSLRTGFTPLTAEKPP